jgi:intracellular septation protein A
MKVLFDFTPVLVFFIAFKIPENSHQGILLATKVFP